MHKKQTIIASAALALVAKDRQKPGCVTAGGGRGGFSGAALPEALLRRVATMVQGQVLCLGEARREAPGATCGAPWQRWAGTLQGCSNCVSTGLQLLVSGAVFVAYVCRDSV